MNKIDQQLQEIKKAKKLALMTHVVVCYPNLEKTYELVIAMEKAGVDFIELQIPFSDPLADGPTIMKACEKTLAQGVTVSDAFLLANKLSQAVHIPLLFMAYYNTVFHFGTEKFCREAAKVGISGLIVPDMPIDEEAEEHFYAYCKKYSLHAIHVISPASTENRLQKNAKVASGFIYATARQGITGVQGKENQELSTYVKRVKNFFSLPLAVGFGIAKPEQVSLLRGEADIAVIGSAVIDVINQSSGKTMIQKVTDFIRSLDMVK